MNPIRKRDDRYVIAQTVDHTELIPAGEVTKHVRSASSQSSRYHPLVNRKHFTGYGVDLRNFTGQLF